MFALNVCALAQANTHLAQLGYYADPEIHIFDGQYWIYPTSSSPAPDHNKGRTYNKLQTELRTDRVVHPVYLLHTSMDAFSSPDLVHWTRHPDILDIKNIALGCVCAVGSVRDPPERQVLLLLRGE